MLRLFSDFWLHKSCNETKAYFYINEIIAYILASVFIINSDMCSALNKTLFIRFNKFKCNSTSTC